MENNNIDEEVIISQLVSDDSLPLANEKYHLSNTLEETSSELMDDALLTNLLQEFQMESVFIYLKDAKVTFKSLQYMKEDDIKEAIPPIGLRMEFREKLFAWKKSEFGIYEDTFSMPSKMGDWQKNCNDPFSTPTSSIKFGTRKKILDEGLAFLLNKSLSGSEIIAFYNLHKKLTNDKRDELIGIIVETFVKKDISLRAQDFPNILAEICEVFPTENKVKEYYYIPRMGKKIPAESCTQNTETKEARKLYKIFTKSKIF